MLSDLAWQGIACSLELSRRELQIVRATFDDRKESAIAEDLGIAPRTVHTHIERLHHKLEVADRLQLVLRIMYEFLRLTISPQGNLPPICSNAAAGCCPLRG
jgi:DNA-binding NarL/FixJ family response regulator